MIKYLKLSIAIHGLNIENQKDLDRLLAYVDNNIYSYITKKNLYGREFLEGDMEIEIEETAGEIEGPKYVEIAFTEKEYKKLLEVLGDHCDQGPCCEG